MAESKRGTAPNGEDDGGELSREDEANEALLAVHGAHDLSGFREVLEDQASALLGCERTVFFQAEREDSVTNLVAIREKDGSRICFPFGEGIAGTVAKDNGYYLTNTPKEDDLYTAALDGLPEIQVRNVLSAAMFDGDETVGVLQCLNKRGGGFEEDDAFWLQRLAEHGALAYVRLKRAADGWNLARDLAEAVAASVDDKHVSTVGHADRTRQVALAIGRDMNLQDDELRELELAALLHDIGRLGLSPEAFEWAGGPGSAAQRYAAPNERLHLVLTEALLRNLKLPASLANLSTIALSHHEKADGTGFPRGKKSAELPRGARILAVANEFDLLTTGRSALSNGKAMDDEQAARSLKERAGKEFDPAVVDRLIRNKLYEIEKRRFPRCAYETPLEVTVLGGAKSEGKAVSQVLQTQALDLSEGGILFRSETKLPADALVKLKIHLPTEVLDAVARIARVMPGDDAKSFKIGAYFLWYGSQG